MTDSKRKRISLIFASLVLLASVMSVTYNSIVEYNREIRIEQFDKKMIANHGAIFAVDAWGINYAQRNRNLMLGLCIVGLVASIFPQSVSFAIIPYGLTFPLIYQWITKTARDLELNQFYTSDTPYLLRIASPVDWALFTLLTVTFTLFLFLLINSRLSLRPKLK